RRIVIIGEGEMVAGIKPAVVGVAEAVEFANVDHAGKMARFAAPSRVSNVTAPALATIETILLMVRHPAETAGFQFPPINWGSRSEQIGIGNGTVFDQAQQHAPDGSRVCRIVLRSR